MLPVINIMLEAKCVFRHYLEDFVLDFLFPPQARPGLLSKWDVYIEGVCVVYGMCKGSYGSLFTTLGRLG